MTLQGFVGDWLYWPLVWIVVSGSVTITLNFVTITYQEIWAQETELMRLFRKIK